MTKLRNKRKPFLVAPTDGVKANANFFCYLREGFKLSIKHGAHVVALIVALFFLSGPAAVFRRIWAIIVDAVNAVLVAWARPHVIQEIVENFPSLTNKNASLAVVFVGLICRVFASAPHIHPDVMLRRISHAVPSFCFRDASAVLASASLGFPEAQILRVDVALSSTHASTREKRLKIFPVRFANDSPVAKSGPDGQFYFAHDSYVWSWEQVQYAIANGEVNGQG